MSGSIRLHPEHGVNPTLGVCFWCNEDSGEIALLGWNKGKEAPRRTMLSYDPCPKCKEYMAMGITFICVAATPNFTDQPSMSPAQPAYPTGQWSVLNEDAVKRILSDAPKLLEAVIKARKTFMIEKEYNEMGFDKVEPVHVFGT